MACRCTRVQTHPGFSESLSTAASARVAVLGTALTGIDRPGHVLHALRACRTRVTSSPGAPGSPPAQPRPWPPRAIRRPRCWSTSSTTAGVSKVVCRQRSRATGAGHKSKHRLSHPGAGRVGRRRRAFRRRGPGVALAAVAASTNVGRGLTQLPVIGPPDDSQRRSTCGKGCEPRQPLL